PLVLALRHLPLPVVCAVNGVAAGAGANIALACDIVVAAKSASFIQAFSKIGLIPDSGGTYFLPRLVGSARAIGLAMLGERLIAEQAAERSEEHTSELQSRSDLVCRLLLEKKKNNENR